jgi:hypothetical protein
MQHEDVFDIDHRGNTSKLFLIQSPHLDLDFFLKYIKADHKMHGIILPNVEL